MLPYAIVEKKKKKTGNGKNALLAPPQTVHALDTATIFGPCWRSAVFWAGVSNFTLFPLSLSPFSRFTSRQCRLARPHHHTHTHTHTHHMVFLSLPPRFSLVCVARGGTTYIAFAGINGTACVCGGTSSRLEQAQS